MRAIILAAGRGSRMKGWTDEMPKVMVKLRGKSLLAHQIEALQAAGIPNIAVVTGYRKEEIRAEGIIRLFENLRWESTNMVRSLMCAEDWLSAGPCIVSYGDIFYAPSAPASLLKSKADVSITYDLNFWELWSRRMTDPLSDLESFRVDTQGYLIAIGGRAKAREDIEGQYMGLLYFWPKGWHEVKTFLNEQPPEIVDKMDMTSLLSMLIKRGTKIKAMPYSGRWGEVDTPDDLALYSS